MFNFGENEDKAFNKKSKEVRLFQKTVPYGFKKRQGF